MILTSRQFLSFLSLFLSFCKGNLPKNTTLFIGNYMNGQMMKTQVFVDIYSENTIISNRDFECTGTYGCKLEEAVYSGPFYGVYFAYRIGMTPMNIANFQFNETAKFIYLLNDTVRLGSVLGISPNSSFIAYYHEQNMRLHYLMKLRLDWSNKITFVKGLPVDLHHMIQKKYEVIITTSPPSLFSDMKINFCFDAMFDYYQRNLSFFSVQPSNYKFWANLVKTHQDTANSNVTFSFDLNQDFTFGNISFPLSELSNGQNQPFINQFTLDDGGCDVICGGLMLRKFNYTMYIEVNQDETIFKEYLKFPNYVEPDASFSILSFLAIFSLILIFSGLTYYAYTYYFAKEPEVRLSYEYRSIGLTNGDVKDTAIVKKIDSRT